jgi:hypothetical protein
MDEEKEAVKEATEPSLAETPAAEVETGSEEESKEVQPEPPKEEASKSPSRAEKRIHGLVEKLKASQEKAVEQPVPQTQTDFTQTLPWQPPQEELTAESLDQLVTTRADAIVKMRMMQDSQQREYETKAKDWASDLEETVKNTPELNPDAPEYNEELDSALREIVEKTNFTKDGQLVPAIKTSEVWSNIKKALDKEREKGQQETTAEMAKQVAEEAVRPGKEQQKQSLTAEEIQKMKWKDPGKLAKMLEETLPVAED